MLGMPKSKVWHWYSGKGVPSLHTLLQICHRIGVLVPDFLCKEAASVSQKITLAGLQLHQPVRFKKQPFNLDKMQRELLVALEETPPRCLKDVVLRIGCCKTTLYNNFPDLIHAIAVRHISYRKTCHEELIERIIQEVYQVAVELHAKQIEPIVRRVAEKLTKPGAIRNKEIRTALHKVRSELEWEVAKVDS